MDNNFDVTETDTVAIDAPDVIDLAARRGFISKANPVVPEAERLSVGIQATMDQVGELAIKLSRGGNDQAVAIGLTLIAGVVLRNAVEEEHISKVLANMLTAQLTKSVERVITELEGGKQ